MKKRENKGITLVALVVVEIISPSQVQRTKESH